MTILFLLFYKFIKKERSRLDNWNGIVSLLIACLELILLINLLVFSQKNRSNKQVMSIISLLMIYQIFEFFICGLNVNQSYIIYLAFAVITFLPPLNLLFSLNYFGYKNKNLIFVFVPALLFILYYAFNINDFTVAGCSVFYASYNYPLGTLYGLFYYSPILISIYLFFKGVKNETVRIKKVLSIFVLAGLLFISIPVLIAFFLLLFHHNGLLLAIESVMCKFAFIYAVCLSFFCLNNKIEKA